MLEREEYERSVWYFFLFAASARIAGSTGIPGSVSRSVQSGSTLMHGVLKLANKTNSKLHNSSGNEVDSHFVVLKAMFNLLSNLALCAECRGILWKVGEIYKGASIQRRYQRTFPSLGPPIKEGELWERGCVSLELKKRALITSMLLWWHHNYYQNM